MKKGLKLLFASFLLLTACNLSYFADAEIGEFVWDPTLAIPLGEFNYTVAELFQSLDDGSTNIGPNVDNIVTLIYEESIDTGEGGDFLRFQDQTLSSVVQAGVDILDSPTEQVIAIEELLVFDLSLQSNEAYDSINFSSGRLEIELKSSISNPIAYRAELISFERANELLSFSDELNSASGNSHSDVLDNTTGYFYLDSLNKISTNKVLIKLQYSVFIPAGGSLSSTNGLELSLKMREVEYVDVFGHVGNQLLEIDDRNMALDFFDIFSSGEVKFRNPTIDIFYRNSFGFPLGMDYSNISALGKDGVVKQLSGPIANQRSIVDAPLIGEESVLDTNHQINIDNSNISELFSSQPSDFRIDVNGLSNPENGPVQYNYLNENHQLNTTFRVEIPLDMNVDQLVANQKLDFKNGKDLNNATRALMRIESTNDMPMGGDMEIQFLNAKGEVVYTIDERPFFDPAPIGDDGRTTAKVKNIAEVQLENEDLRAMEDAARFAVKTRLNSTHKDQGLEVKFYNDYRLVLQVGMLVDLQVKSSGQ